MARPQGGGEIGDPLPFGHSVPGSPEEALTELVAALLHKFESDLTPRGRAQFLKGRLAVSPPLAILAVC